MSCQNKVKQISFICSVSKNQHTINNLRLNETRKVFLPSDVIRMSRMHNTLKNALIEIPYLSYLALFHAPTSFPFSANEQF